MEDGRGLKSLCDLVRVDPLVKAVLARFPGAEIMAVRRLYDAPPAPSGEHEESAEEEREDEQA
jgi:hypothetical protein